MEKKVFKVTDSLSSKVQQYFGFMPGVPGQVPPIPSWEWIPTVEDVQGQIDDIVDSIENNYCVGFVFDKYDYFISTHPFYFYFEVPLGTSEIISARVSFEVKDYRNASLTHSRYAINGDPTDRPVITFSVSEDKGHLFRDIYGPYETDMRAIDILGDLTGEGIKVIKFETDNDVCVTARVFLRLKINKNETPDAILDTLLERQEVRTLAATSLADISATLNGDIVSVGRGSYTDKATGEIKPVSCTKRGFKYGLTKVDTWDTNESDSYVRGTFGIGITGLTAETDYYFRAYADNQVGRSYGEYVKLTTTAPVPAIYVAYENFTDGETYINVYSVNGTYITQWLIEESELYYGDNIMCVDINGNVYTINSTDHDIRKRDSDGNILLVKVETNYIYNIAVGPDGYIYTLQYDSAFNNGYISKRNASDLVSVGTITIDAGGTKGTAWDGFTIDSDGNFYMTNSVDDRYEKWTWAGGKIASRDSTSSISEGGLGVAGTKLGSLDGGGRHAITILLTLGANEADGDLDVITRPDKIGTISGYLLYCGRGATSIRHLGKYTSSLGKIWTTEIPDSGNFGLASIAAYPF